jgi:predicted dehydrogenase
LAECILEDRSPLSSPERQVRIHEIIDAIYRSAEKGQVVQLN